MESPHLSRRWTLRDWVLFSGALLVALGLGLSLADPELVGIWEDDAIYLSAAAAQARGAGLAIELLPGSPLLAKQPPLYPWLLSLVIRAGADLAHPRGLWWILLFQGSIFAFAAALYGGVLLRRMELGLAERVAALVLFVVNATILGVATTTMSEGLFLLLFTGQLLCLVPLLGMTAVEKDTKPPGLASGVSRKSGPGRGWLLAFLFFAFTTAVCATRGIGLVMSLGFLPLLLARRRWLAVVALATAFALALGVSGHLRAKARADREARLASIQMSLSYYVDYDNQLFFYRKAWAEGGTGGLLRALGAVAAANAESGLDSFAQLFFPTRKLQQPGSQEAPWSRRLEKSMGLALFLLCLLGLLQGDRTRWALVPPLLLFTCFFAVWTWPFSARFWVSAMPLLAVGLVRGCRKFDRIGPFLLWSLVVASASMHGLVLGQRMFPGQATAAGTSVASTANPASSENQSTPEEAPPIDELQRYRAWLRDAVAGRRQDLLLGGFTTLWTARTVGIRGLWIGALLDPADQVSVTLQLRDGADPEPRTIRKFAQRLADLAQFLPPGARVLVQVDGSLSPPVFQLLQVLASAGLLRELSPPSPVARLYEFILPLSRPGRSR